MPTPQHALAKCNLVPLKDLRHQRFAEKCLNLVVYVSSENVANMEQHWHLSMIGGRFPPKRQADRYCKAIDSAGFSIFLFF